MAPNGSWQAGSRCYQLSRSPSLPHHYRSQSRDPIGPVIPTARCLPSSYAFQVRCSETSNPVVAVKFTGMIGKAGCPGPMLHTAEGGSATVSAFSFGPPAAVNDDAVLLEFLDFLDFMSHPPTAAR